MDRETNRTVVGYLFAAFAAANGGLSLVTINDIANRNSDIREAVYARAEEITPNVIESADRLASGQSKYLNLLMLESGLVGVCAAGAYRKLRKD